ncbi:MAG: 4'-phosphopantetheinyl transferase family protein [Roseburia sp.]
MYIADVTLLQDEDLYRKLYMRLDAARRSKADGFLFARDKRLSVGAGALLLHALQQEKVENASVVVESNGKPYLAGEENLYFNLSHSGNMVMCALSDQEVGCDVEQMDVFEHELAEYVMTEQELSRIYCRDGDTGQREMFFRLWTLKESYMKATGFGISLEPKNFGIEFREDGIQAVPSVDQRKFHFKEYVRNDGYCYSCCSLAEEFPDVMIEVDLRRNQ